MNKAIKKTKKIKEHVTYNKKGFLAPESITSMSAYFTKIYKNGMAIIRISDCNNTIKIWNDMNDKKQVEEMLTKIDTLQDALDRFKKEIILKKGF
ncbi:hypothetical protein [Flavobacterium sp. 25HG05S-40]|uniref:hypothetical protein n=1 Tax=Flavobacterium sp. 25HG05S-40 TaxID=3458682 RepID=UPI0040448A1F